MENRRAAILRERRRRGQATARAVWFSQEISGLLLGVKIDHTMPNAERLIARDMLVRASMTMRTDGTFCEVDKLFARANLYGKIL
jgi:hypothetical protein